MAASGGERRMVFDIRGRRKHVVKAVYAILALLMGASLFLVVGPVNIGNLIGNSASNETSSRLEDEALAIERKLKKDPENEQLLLNLIRTRITTANTLATVSSETGLPTQTVESRQQLEKASSAWSRYLKASAEPTAGGAQIAAPMLFTLAETSRTGAEAEANVKAAANAQRIVAEQRPSLGSLSTQAIYTFFTFDYPAAEKAGREARKYTTSKSERENLEKELQTIRKRAHEFQKQLAEFNKAAKGQGKESLKNPFGGLGGESSLTGP